MATAPDHVKAQNRASRRALQNLRQRHPEEYEELYVKEALLEGVMPRSERDRILYASQKTTGA